MTITLNGEQRELPDGTSAAALLETLDIHPEHVVVEVDLDIIPRDALEKCELRNGATVEIIKFVGGG
ncbi:MAG: sulfur carrier protein ThiS [bacterium]